jgi:hypothetical protein
LIGHLDLFVNPSKIKKTLLNACILLKGMGLKEMGRGVKRGH